MDHLKMALEFRSSRQVVSHERVCEGTEREGGPSNLGFCWDVLLIRIGIRIHMDSALCKAFRLVGVV